MGQEFFINSQTLEDQVRKLLPSQGGAGAGFDLSASTQIIPIIDLTESAEGSNLRQDLQTALSFTTATVFNVRNTATTVIVNTGYWRITGVSSIATDTAIRSNLIQINDGTSTKNVWDQSLVTASSDTQVISSDIDITVFLDAGDSLIISSSNSSCIISGSVRQVADITGALVNP
jgi:hypothetical protein